jgi:hypothetical protein
VYFIDIKKKPLIYHENPLNGSQVFPCGWMEGQKDIWADMMKLIIAFCNFANVPQNGIIVNKCCKLKINK